MKRALTLRLLALATCVLVTSGCGGSSEDEDPTSDAPPALPEIPNDTPVLQPTALVCPTGTFLTYRNFGASFMNRYCTTCHGAEVPEEKRGGAPLAANFDTAADLNVWRAQILTRAAGLTPTMPPSGQVTSADREALGEWLNCGAPQ